MARPLGNGGLTLLAVQDGLFPPARARRAVGACSVDEEDGGWGGFYLQDIVSRPAGSRTLSRCAHPMRSPSDPAACGEPLVNQRHAEEVADALVGVAGHVAAPGGCGNAFYCFVKFPTRHLRPRRTRRATSTRQTRIVPSASRHVHRDATE